MRTFEQLIAPYSRFLRDWDKTRKTTDCLHCHGTGKAPGDGRTECGFCEHG